jgi:NitT/TauT family transport system substrate-binding protein
MRLERTIGAIAIALAATAGLAACSSSSAAPPAQAGPSAQAQPDAQCAKPGEMTTATIATGPGMQDFVIKHVKATGLDKKYNLNLDVHSFQNPTATAPAIVQKAVDLGFGGLPTMVQARSTGSDIIVIGALAIANNGVFVTKDSPYQDLKDLKGKKIGSFSPTNGAIGSIVQAYTEKAYGFNLFAEAEGKVHVAPDAALLGLMDNNQLDVAVLGADGSALQRAAGKYRMVTDLGVEFRKQFGFDAVYLAPVTTEEYAKAHCGVVRAFTSALHDALVDITSNPKVWDDYAKAVGQPDKGSAFQDAYSHSLMTEYGPDQIEGMKKLMVAITPYLDANFPKEVDPDLFSLDYLPFDK